MRQSVRLNIGLCHHYGSVELENVSVAMAMITPEKANVWVSTQFIQLKLYIKFSVFQYGG